MTRSSSHAGALRVNPGIAAISGFSSRRGSRAERTVAAASRCSPSNGPRTRKEDVMAHSTRTVGLLLTGLTLSLAVPATAVATGHKAPPGREFRISPDDRPGSYRRLDGTRDALHDACSVRRRQQAEPTIAVNPRDPRVIAAGAMDACIGIRYPSPAPQPQHALAYYRSADAGRTWSASLFPGHVVADSGPASDLACTMHEDPSMAFDRRGRLFYAALCPVYAGFSTTDFQVAVATFDHDGSRFVQAVRADPAPPPEQEAVRSADKVTLAVDTTHSLALRQRLRRLPRVRRTRDPRAMRQRERIRHPRRAVHRPRQDVLRSGRDRGARGPLRELGRPRHRTRRHALRDVPQLAHRRTTADLDRALDRRRQHVLARAAGCQVPDV